MAGIQSILQGERGPEEALRENNQNRDLYRRAKELTELFSRFRHDKQSKTQQLLAGFLELVDQSGYPFQKIAERVFIDFENKYRKRTPNRLEVIQEIGRDRHALYKTGSKLEVLFDVKNPEKPTNGVFINTISSKSADIWAKLASGEITAEGGIIAVAPILTRADGSLRIHRGEYSSRVFSRYCGPDIGIFRHGFLRGKASRILGVGPQNGIDGPEWLADEMGMQITDILTNLEKLGFNYGNVHEGNFTYELMKEPWITEQFAENPALNVNTITYDPENWSFDIRDKITDPDSWRLVVRLIDLDGIGDKNAAQPSASYNWE